MKIEAIDNPLLNMGYRDMHSSCGSFEAEKDEEGDFKEELRKAIERRDNRDNARL